MSAAICRWYVTDNAAGAEKPCCGMGTGFAQLASGTCLILCKHLGSMVSHVAAYTLSQPLSLHAPTRPPSLPSLQR